MVLISPYASIWILMVLMGFIGPNASLGVLIGPYGSLCVLMGRKCPSASLRILMGPYESLCILTRVYGSLQVLIGPYTFLWIPVGT